MGHNFSYKSNHQLAVEKIKTILLNWKQNVVMMLL